MARKGGKRPLQPGEKALWHKVTETVAPLPDTPLPDLPLPEELSEALNAAPRPPTPTPARAPHTPRPKETEAARFEAGDPGLAKRVARGRLAIDATLDLHGYSQREAQTRLAHFMDFAALRGDRVVLIITGKGAVDSEDHRPFEEAPRGILRLRFLDWIETAPLRERISSVRQAHQKHGGRGAFYVFLKPKPKKSRAVSFIG